MITKDQNEAMQLKLIQEAPKMLPSDEKMCTMVFDLHKVRDYAVKHCISKEELENEAFEVDEIVQDYIKLLHHVWLFRKEVESALKD